MRNPSAVLDRWPLLAKSLWPLRSVLEVAMSNLPQLQGLAGAVGKNPKRAPPSSETITSLREQVARALHIPPADAESHHAASSLRPAFFKWVIEASKDPDAHIVEWLIGAPMGITRPITLGGHFPVRAVAAEVEESELPADWPGNHPSFARTPEGELEWPAMEIIKGYIRHGYGTVFRSRAAAENAHTEQSPRRRDSQTQDHSGFKVKQGE